MITRRCASLLLSLVACGLFSMLTAGCASRPGDAAGDPLVESRVTVQNLQPVIRAVGVSGAAPKAVILEFSRPVLDDVPEYNDWEEDPTPSPALEGTVVSLWPELPGSLRYTSRSTLVFTPEKDPTPGTRYTLTLSSLGTRDGILKAPEPNPWTYSFAVPAFGFLRLEPYGLGENEARVGVVFTHRPDREALSRLGEWRAGEQLITDVAYEGDENVLRATLKGPQLKPGVQLSFKLQAGLPMAGDGAVTAKAAGGKVRLETASAVEIVSAGIREGTNGFYFAVFCDDDAVKADKVWVDNWDYQASPRCFFPETALATGLHIEPAIKTTVSAVEGGFRLLGDFKRGSYTLRLDAGLKTVDGGVLLAPFEQNFTVSARSPSLAFASKGRYLPRSAWKSLAVRSLNVDRAMLTVKHIPMENLHFWLSGQDETVDGRTANIIFRRMLPVAMKPDQPDTFFLDVGSLLPDVSRGVYELTISSGSVFDSARLLLTDMNLVVKSRAREPGEEWTREAHVWATEMHTGAPLSGVEMRLIRMSGFVLARCTTDSSGGCRLEVPPMGIDPNGPFAVLASRGDDFTYLKFADLKLEISDQAVQGDPYLLDRPYTAAMYSDRGVYRPGELAHVGSILRDRNTDAPKAGMPVTFLLDDPRGLVIKEVQALTNASGMAFMDVPFDPLAITGRYRVRLEAAGRALQSYEFHVEEFVPERMAVSLRAARPAFLTTEPSLYQLSARYLFGGSAEGHVAQLDCRLEPAEFKPAENSQYTYGIWTRPDEEGPGELSVSAEMGVLSAEGTAALTCPAIEEAATFQGPAMLLARAEVMEAGSGRTSSGVASVPAHPERYYLGLLTQTAKVEEGKPFTVQGVVVDWNGKLAPAAVKEVAIELNRLEVEYDWYYYQREGEETMDRHLRPMVEGMRKVPVSGGKFSFTVTPTAASDAFLVTARAGKARTDLKLPGVGGSYWWEARQTSASATPRPLKPTRLVLDGPAQIKVGEAASVRFKAPYRGRVLMTVETYRVIQSAWLEVDPGPQTWSFTLPEFAPNVYVSAFLVKDPHLESKAAFLPERAFGVVSLRVEPTAFTYPVKIEVPAELRSSSRLEVKLDLGPIPEPATATVAVVDEGILSLTRFKTPDPFPSIFTRRALGVETYETVGWTLLMPAAGASKESGGDMGLGPQRVPPVRPVALWSGPVTVPESGKVTVPFDIPPYYGKLRVMVMAAGKQKLGKGEASVTIKDPLVVQATLPRFLTEGDEVQLPVFVTNVSGKAQSLKVRLKVEDLPLAGLESAPDAGLPLQLTVGEAPLSLADKASGTAVLSFKVVRKVGAVRLTAEVEGSGYVARETLEAPILPTGPRSRQVQQVELPAGVTDLKPYLKGWVPMSEASTFWVTGNPYGQAFDHLKSLVRYPYGCLEQTVSSTLPLLYVSNLLYAVDPGLLSAQSLEKRVQHGIDRVLAMQGAGGGFGYWPGDSVGQNWQTAYALLLLMEAQKLRYDVPQARVDQAVGFLERALGSHLELTPAGSLPSREGAEAYVQYVLARAGKARKARLQQLVIALTGGTGPQAEALYLAQAGLYLAGDRRYEAALKAPDVGPLQAGNGEGRFYYSDLRRRGLMLSIFVDLFGRDPAGQGLARVVAEGLRKQEARYYTTQELAWAATGLGRYAESGSRGFSVPVLLANGKAVSAQKIPAGQAVNDRTWGLARASEYSKLELKLDSTGGGKVYLFLASEGIRVDGQGEVGGKGLSLSRRLLDGQGQPIDVAQTALELGDSVYLEETLRNDSGRDVENLALVQRFPAGLEAENARLGAGVFFPGMDEDSQWKVEYANLRDDRLEAFGKLTKGQTVKLVTPLRVVSAGSYTLPTGEVEAMYEPSVWARAPGARLKVTGEYR